MSTKDKNKKGLIINILVVAAVIIGISFTLHKVLGRNFFLMLLLFTVLYGAITFFVEVLNAFLKNKKGASAKAKEDEEKEKEPAKKTSSTGWTSPVREDNVPKYEEKPFRFDGYNTEKESRETTVDEKPVNDSQNERQNERQTERPSVSQSEPIADNPFSTSKRSSNDNVKTPFERTSEREPERPEERKEERKYVIPDVHFTFTTKKEEVKEEEVDAPEEEIIDVPSDEQPHYETVIDYPTENEEPSEKSEIPDEAPTEWTDEKSAAEEDVPMNGRERLESVLETGNDFQYGYETIKNIDTIESETKDISESIRSALEGSSERKQIRFITVDRREDKNDPETVTAVQETKPVQNTPVQSTPAQVTKPVPEEKHIRETKAPEQRPESRPRLFDSEVEETTLISNPYAGSMTDEKKERNDNRVDKVVADKSKLSKLFCGKTEQETPKEQKQNTFAGYTKQENVGTHDVRDEIDDEFSGKDFQIKPSPSKTPSYTSRVGQSAYQVRPSEQAGKAPQKSPEYTGTEEKPAAVVSMAADKQKPKRPKYKVPSLDILADHRDVSRNPEKEEQAIRDNEEKLISSLASFGINAKITNAQRGPSVTRYELQPEPGVKVSRILSLSDDIALSLASAGIRFEAPIPGKSAIGIEVPNKDTDIVYLKDVLKSQEYLNAPSKLSVGLGRDIAGNVVVGDITKFPHVLIAGSTGSGKSVCINTIITSILFKASPDEVKMIMIDPKVVELGIYNGLPHLLVPVVTNPKKAAAALNWAVNEVENRYAAFAEKRVRDLKGYNMSLAEGEQTMPHIVIIIDELADLMMTSSKEVEDSIIRLAQKARAAGVHLVIATQRPSVDVITGLIKANIPSRIAFAVTSYIDSRTILDAAGAEKLLGRGDMLYHPIGMIKPKRVQGAFVSDDEVENLVNEIKMTYGETEYSQEVINAMDKPAGDKAGPSSGKNEEEDNADLEMIIQAGDLAVEFGQMSTSFLQRKLKLGFGRAARIIDALEERGIVSAAEGSKPRSTLISKEDWEKIKETI